MSDRSRRAAALFLILALAAGIGTATAGTEPAVENPHWKLNGAYLRKLPADLAWAFTAPVRWDGKDFLTFAAVAGTTALLFAFDGEIYDWIQDHKTSSSTDASPVISKFGNGGYLTGFLALLYGSGEIFGSRSFRKTALVGFESFLAASAMVTVIKLVVGRARPYAHEGPEDFRPFSFQGRYMSFASGDAAGIFAVATTIAEQSDSFWLDALAFTAAGVTAFYRVHDRKHWPSDVFAGSAIGYFAARAINALNRNGDSVRVSFQAGPDRRSVTLSFAF